jgi:hypothetical protein
MQNQEQKQDLEQEQEQDHEQEQEQEQELGKPSRVKKEKQPETDFNKMTREEKEADGWTMLALNRAAVVNFIDTLEEQEFPECIGTFTFAEMAALCTDYEKRVVKEMNIYRDKAAKVSAF